MKMDIVKQKASVAASQQEDLSKLHQERLDRCIPVARAILELIASSALPLGDKVLKRDAEGNVMKMEEDNRPQEYVDTGKKVLQLMLDANLRWPERQFVFSLVKQPMDMLQNICLMDTDKTLQDGLNNMFGVKYFGDVTMQQVDEFVKKMSEPDVAPVDSSVPAEPVAPTETSAPEALAPEVPSPADTTQPEQATVETTTPPTPDANTPGTN